MKLRLNLKNADLAFRFGVAESTVSKIIHKWLSILYISLKFLIRWPTREEVQATLPECFRSKFGKAVVIIGCTEIFIERATNLLARSQTWSKLQITLYNQIFNWDYSTRDSIFRIKCMGRQGVRQADYTRVRTATIFVTW